MNTLKLLLDELRKRQSWCPYCGYDHSHGSGCILIGLWFEGEINKHEST